MVELIGVPSRFRILVRSVALSAAFVGAALTPKLENAIAALLGVPARLPEWPTAIVLRFAMAGAVCGVLLGVWQLVLLRRWTRTLNGIRQVVEAKLAGDGQRYVWLYTSPPLMQFVKCDADEMIVWQMDMQKLEAMVWRVRAKHFPLRSGTLGKWERLPREDLLSDPAELPPWPRASVRGASLDQTLDAALAKARVARL